MQVDNCEGIRLVGPLVGSWVKARIGQSLFSIAVKIGINLKAIGHWMVTDAADQLVFRIEWQFLFYLLLFPVYVEIIIACFEFQAL